MRRLIQFLTLGLLLHLNNANAQQDIVNGDFEFWNSIPGTNELEDPAGWTSNNWGIFSCTTGTYLTGISRSTDAYCGLYSLKIRPSF